MLLTLLKSKIHRAIITHCELHYEGSCAIDADLLNAAQIYANEQVHIWNIHNGQRLITYAIEAKAGSGVISLNGSAARYAAVGDLIIIASFAQIAEEQAKIHLPKLVFVNENNQIKELRHDITSEKR
jgi:L-aspartate-alpha-decarboxylase